MATSTFTRTYPKPEFTAASGVPNVAIFTTEVAALSLTIPVSQVYDTGGAIVVELNGDPDAADITALDGAVAAHVGGVLQVVFQEVFDNAQQDNTTTSLVVAADFTTAQMAAGDYMWTWSGEILVLTQNPDNAGVCDVRVDQANGGGLSQRMTHHTNGVFHSSGTPVFESFSGQEAFSLADGETTRIQFRFRKVGSPANTCSVRRLRGTLIRLGGG